MRTIARTLFSFRGRLSLGGFWAGVIGAAIVVIAAFIVTGTVGGRTAQYLVASPKVLAPGMDPRKLKDKFSSSYLIALASRMAQEVGEAQAIAEKAGKPLPTLSTDVEIRLRSPREREAFAEELLDAIARLAAKYHDETHPDGRTYRLVVGAHPIRPTRRKS